MKEFIEKLIGRLEEEKSEMKKPVMANANCISLENSLKDVFNSKIDKIIEIVNQLAEEYSNDKVNQIAMMYAKSISKYGVDIGAKWETATQQSMALSQAYMRGRQDERYRFSQLQEEYDNDFCEWKKVKNNEYVCLPHAESHDSRVLDWCVCPYCGKKIKIAPYQPKGE